MRPRHTAALRRIVSVRTARSPGNFVPELSPDLSRIVSNFSQSNEDAERQDLFLAWFNPRREKKRP